MDVFISKVTSRGQITLPSELRREEGITGRDYVIMRKIGGNIIVTKLINRLGEITSIFEAEAESQGITKAQLLSELDTVRKKSRRR